METALNFLDHSVRMFIDEEGLPWWFATDVGRVLAISNIRVNLRGMPQDEIRVRKTYTEAGIRSFVTVNEPGLYRLIFSSRKPEAEAFKTWVFNEVIPQIRRTGQYIRAQAQPEYLPSPTPRMREHAEVSMHLVSVWRILCNSQEWLSNNEISHLAGVAQRTARSHTKYLLQLGLLDMLETFPRHLYRLSGIAEKRNPSAFARFQMIAEVVRERLHIS